MTSIHIQRNHQMGHQGIRDLSERVANELAHRYQIRWRWQGNELRFKRAGASGLLLPETELITLQMKLGLVLMPMAKVIEIEIESQLDALLARQQV